MLILRCTQKLRKRLGVDFEDAPEPNESLLGGWYVNVLPAFEDVAILVNERTRLGVLVHLPLDCQLDDLADRFRRELGELLLDVHLSGRVIQRIMDEHAGQVSVIRTDDRSLLGTMNDFASLATDFIEGQLEDRAPVDLRAIHPQLYLAPLKPLGWASAIKKLYEVAEAIRQ